MTEQLLPPVIKRNQNYSLLNFLATAIIIEGELSRHVERQKNKLTRWAVLKKEALLIYKDKLNSRSFPEKPLVCIPLNEVN